MTEENTDLCEWAELYALGALQDDEMERFEVHLQECPECEKLVKEYRQVIELLPLASEPVQPPSGMKKRILSRVTEAEATVQKARDPVSAVPEPVRTERETTVKTVPVPRKKPLLRYLSAGLAAAVVGLLIYTGQLRQDIGQLQRQADISAGQLQEAKVNEAVVLSPSAAEADAKGLATIIADNGGTHLVVQAEGLPELTGTEVYQVWLIKGDVPQNAGTFVAQGGNGALYYTFEPQQYDTVAITLEPDAGGETPRGQIVLAAPIKQG
ncbi:anti-sigma factor [Paenibacillus camerounensis]|uniref:anti-sigma factor n=1 Tax=Paenibacillus camerounensis TaxID=1243663 RepID=UPI0005A717AE|nr:anti-sigma factor [Paenibacillus camerounensis]